MTPQYHDEERRLSSRLNIALLAISLFGFTSLNLTLSAHHAVYAQCVEAPSMLTPASEQASEQVSDVESAPMSEALPPPMSEPLTASLSPTRYLRALSLDLRGKLPSADEYERVQGEGLDEALLDELLSAPELAQELTRYHQSLLWGKLGDLTFSNNTLSPSGRSRLYWRRNSANSYRGARVSCLDEPARFGVNGEILTTEVDGANLEGWVEVSPYWDPENPIKVCAFDAQEATFSPSGEPCAERSREPSCGCGPSLTWCASTETEREVKAALIESFERFMLWVFSGEGSYLELFQSQRMYVNGPLVHFFRHLTATDMRYSFQPAPIDVNALPSLPYTARDTWVPLTLSRDHAGVLTHPVFLLRFQTNRARANRFFDAFLCSPFQPPEGGLPVADEAAVRDPDLQRRAGCKYCHALLEPAAAHWGRWTEQGVSYLPAERFPASRADCLSCALTGQGCNLECRENYLTDALTEQERPFLGKLKAYVFRDVSHELNVEQGPRLLVMNEVVRQRMPRCVASRAASWLLGRELTSEDEAWLNALALRFSRGGFMLRPLLSEILRSERYRRVK